MSLRADAVPGWVLDHVVGETGDHVLVAARRAAVLGPGEVPEYATFRFARAAGPVVDPEADLPPVVAPLRDDPVPGPRRPVAPSRTVAAVTASVVVVIAAGLVGLAPPRSSAAGVEPVVEWDPVTATATVAAEDGPRVFRIGAPGDQLVTGDWWADGRTTAVLYRPATGERWLFEAWAGTDHDVAPRALVTAPPHGTLHVRRVAGRDVPIVDRP